MHYVGMMAMVCDCKMEWDGGLVFLSVLIAMIAGSAAFWILFRLLALNPQLEILRVLSAVVMMVAVMSMHYTGMVAASYESLASGEAMDMPGSNISSSTAMQVAVIGNILWSFLMNALIQSEMRCFYRDLVDMDNMLAAAHSTRKYANDDFMHEYKTMKTNMEPDADHTESSAARDMQAMFASQNKKYAAVAVAVAPAPKSTDPIKESLSPSISNAVNTLDTLPTNDANV